MALADRGGASGLIGHRWADISADAARDLVGATRGDVAYTRLIRLDDVPSIASTAAKRGMQNPDLLLFGERDGVEIIQAADAKFSVETARAKQVSAEVVEALLGLGPAIDRLLTGASTELHAEPGFFICPDFPLTHAMLNGRHGILKTTVRRSEVLLTPIDGDAFFSNVAGASLMPPLSNIDRFGVDLSESLLAGLYYFRLARSAVGCWLDSVKPLLVFHDDVPVDLNAVEAGIAGRAASAPSAYRLILDWNDESERFRAQRAEIDRVTGLPLMSKDLRALTIEAMKGLPGEPPSANQVRRRLGAWFRGQLRDELGPIPPPVDDLDAVLATASRAAKRLAARLPEQAKLTIREIAAERAKHAEPSPSDTARATD
jgi:hypothetical protein